jgi:hypothetical protein
MMYLTFKMARKQPHDDSSGLLVESPDMYSANYERNGITVGLTGATEEVEKLYALLKKYYSVSG